MELLLQFTPTFLFWHFSDFQDRKIHHLEYARDGALDGAILRAIAVNVPVRFRHLALGIRHDHFGNLDRKRPFIELMFDGGRDDPSTRPDAHYVGVVLDLMSVDAKDGELAVITVSAILEGVWDSVYLGLLVAPHAPQPYKRKWSQCSESFDDIDESRALRVP
ncbi:uncharacterized protein FOMMEDRAFT_152354 [Fomitiporia mediterranea MF3/22]|uniref:uncharacterized protein n=1 Tax=Fomitiporia mediterranea (strain MF3/22) TaxID=694068 RepID=UPI00044075E1|nr:uncharacterized protein FOMMEDRAFT_152354 [Fomitiporia mediterranea MF3/22]EJD07013.1 hypothetical protein FOMMEDRAFT_152354 [Fomitiporia mediterranea MF3/22]